MKGYAIKSTKPGDFSVENSNSRAKNSGSGRIKVEEDGNVRVCERERERRMESEEKHRRERAGNSPNFNAYQLPCKRLGPLLLSVRSRLCHRLSSRLLTFLTWLFRYPLVSLPSPALNFDIQIPLFVA